MRHSVLIESLQNFTNRLISQTEIANILGVSPQVINKRALRNSQYSDEELLLLKEKYQCQFTDNLDIMYRQNVDEITLDYFEDIEASCGNGLMVTSESKQKISVAKEVIANYSQSKKYSVIRAISDSMQPEIKPKDFLIVEHVETIKDNHIYIFCYQEKLYCKYLSCNLGQIIVRSANELYPVRYIEGTDAEDFRVIGEVVGIMRGY